MIELDNIYNMDCLEGMKAMPDGSVDCVVTSPPYNFCLRVMGDQYKHRTEGERFGNTDIPMNKYTNGLSDSLDMEDYYKWQCECIDEMMRVTKGVVFYNVQVITGNKVAVMKILGKYAEQIRDLLIWDKKTAEPAMHFGCLNSEFELIIAFDHGDCKGRQFRTANWERGTLSNIIRIGKIDAYRRTGVGMEFRGRQLQPRRQGALNIVRRTRDGISSEISACTGKHINVPDAAAGRTRRNRPFYAGTGGIDFKT